MGVEPGGDVEPAGEGAADVLAEPVDRRRIAVERNREIVRKPDYESVPLAPSLSPPAGTARQRGENKSEIQNPKS